MLVEDKMKKVLVVGSINTVFVHSYLAMFLDSGCEVALVDTSSVDIVLPINGIKVFPIRAKVSKNSSAGFLRRVKELVKKFGFDRNFIGIFLLEFFEAIGKLPLDVERRLHGALKGFEPDIIFCFWGTTLRREVRSIDRFYAANCLSRPHLVLDVNTYPTRANFALERWNYLSVIDRSYFNLFDSVLCSSNVMRDFLLKSKLISSDNSIVFPDFLSSRYFPQRFDLNPSLECEGVNIVFLGNCDFRARTIDDVSLLLNSFAEAGFCVWIQTPPYACNLHHNIKTFKPMSYSEMSSGQFGEFVSQFDGALVAYSGLENARGAISYPTRLALATAGGVPILIKEGQYRAIEEVLGSMEGLLIKYRTAKELSEEYPLEEFSRRKKVIRSQLMRFQLESSFLKLMEFISRK